MNIQTYTIIILYCCSLHMSQVDVQAVH